MSRITHIKNKVHLLLINILEYFAPKEHLDGGDTILVNTETWRLFDESRFKCNYAFNTCPISRIADEDLSKVVAYLGYIDFKQLKRLSDRLNWLQLHSHGYNHYDDISLYKNKDVIVSNVFDVYSKSISQYCISSYYYFNTYSFSKINGGGYLIDNVMVIIYGLGNIGMTLAEKCKQMGWTVYGVKRDTTNCSHEYVDGVFSIESAKQVIQICDYVVNLLPENEASIGLYNLDFFKSMKNTAVFCNVGRKTAVVDSDLSEAVNKHYIRGAILDAHNDYDYKTDRVVLTDHTSYKTSENDAMFDKFFTKQLWKFIYNEKLNNILHT